MTGRPRFSPEDERTAAFDLATSESVDSVIAIVAGFAALTYGSEYLQVWTSAERPQSGGKLQIVQELGPVTQTIVPDLYELQSGDGIAGKVWGTSSVFYGRFAEPDVMDAVAVKDFVVREGFRSVCALPVDLGLTTAVVLCCSRSDRKQMAPEVEESFRRVSETAVHRIGELTRLRTTSEQLYVVEDLASNRPEQLVSEGVLNRLKQIYDLDIGFVVTTSGRNPTFTVIGSLERGAPPLLGRRPDLWDWLRDADVLVLNDTRLAIGDAVKGLVPLSNDLAALFQSVPDETRLGGLRLALCPIGYRDKVFGMLLIGRKSSKPPFGAESVSVLRGVGSSLGLALATRRELSSNQAKLAAAESVVAAPHLSQIRQQIFKELERQLGAKDPLLGRIAGGTANNLDMIAPDNAPAPSINWDSQAFAKVRDTGSTICTAAPGEMLVPTDVSGGVEILEPVTRLGRLIGFVRALIVDPDESALMLMRIFADHLALAETESELFSQGRREPADPVALGPAVVVSHAAFRAHVARVQPTVSTLLEGIDGLGRLAAAVEGRAGLELRNECVGIVDGWMDGLISLAEASSHPLGITHTRFDDFLLQEFEELLHVFAGRCELDFRVSPASAASDSLPPVVARDIAFGVGSLVALAAHVEGADRIRVRLISDSRDAYVTGSVSLVLDWHRAADVGGASYDSVSAFADAAFVSAEGPCHVTSGPDGSWVVATTLTSDI